MSGCSGSDKSASAASVSASAATHLDLGVQHGVLDERRRDVVKPRGRRALRDGLDCRLHRLQAPREIGGLGQQPASDEALLRLLRRLVRR